MDWGCGGLAGVTAILRPGTDAFSWLIILPLLGVVFYSIAMVLTLSKYQDDKVINLAVGMHGTVAAYPSVG